MPVYGTPNSIYISKVVAPYVINQFRSLLRYQIPSGKQMVPISFESMSTTAGRNTNLCLNRKLGSYSLSTGIFTAGSSVSVPRFFGRVYFEVTGSVGLVATTLTMTYENQDGTSGRTATAAVTASSIVGRRGYFTLQDPDIGAIKATNMTNTPAATGTMDIYGETVVTTHRNITANDFKITDFHPAMFFPSDDLVSLEINSSSTTGNQRDLKFSYMVF